MSNFFQRFGSSILIILLCFTQYGCQGFRNPPDSVVKEALQLQIQMTHDSLNKFLALDHHIAEVVRVKVDSTNYVQFEEGKLLSVSGYSYCKFPDLAEKVASPFNLFLERGEKGQSWRLAKGSFSSNSSFNQWTTYPLPIKIDT